MQLDIMDGWALVCVRAHVSYPVQRLPLFCLTVCVCAHVRGHASVCASVRLFMSPYSLGIRVCICIYVCVCVCFFCMFVSMSVCMCVCAFVYSPQDCQHAAGKASDTWAHEDRLMPLICNTWRLG
jgi:hypothetical protein